MAHAIHLPQAPSRVAALGVAALVAGAGGALAISEIAERSDQGAPTVQVVPTPVSSPNPGPASGCYPKWGC